MPTSKYFFRVSFVDSVQPLNGLKMNYTEPLYLDKKQFTIGSGPDADIKIDGPDVDAIHMSVRIEGTKLFIKNFSQGNTQLSSYKVPFDKVEPYTPGEAIRIGGSTQVLFVELFRKFVDPISESEAIIREAWERAEEAEKIVEEHKNVLMLLKKQANDLKVESEGEAGAIVGAAQAKAKGIEAQAVKAKEHLIQATLQERDDAVQQVQQDLERQTQELHVAAEANARKLVEQARLKNKDLKQEAEKEIEALQLSAQRQAELTIDIAKKRILEMNEESRLQIEAFTHRKLEIEKDIVQTQQRQKEAVDGLAKLRSELAGLDQSKKDLQREHDLEKERLRLANSSLHEQLVAKESEMRAMKAKVEDFAAHLGEMKEDLKQVQGAAHTAHLDKENSQAETERLNQQIRDLSENMRQMQAENEGISSRLSLMRFEESQERDKQRERLRKEYEAQKEFDLQWHSQQRLVEQQNAQREKVILDKLEQDGLQRQARQIVGKILPLLSLELTARLSVEQATVLLSQLEVSIIPILERSVVEEYEFRRKHWVEIQPVKVDRLVKDYKNSLRKQYGLVAASAVLFLMAILLSWSKATGLQVAYLTFEHDQEAQASTLQQPPPLQNPVPGQVLPPRMPASRY